MNTAARAAVLLGLGAGLAACSKDPASPPASPPARDPPAVRAEPQPLTRVAFPSSAPREEAYDSYVGSQSCQECHPKQHASWHRSYHRTMTQRATPDAVKADFNNVRLESMGEQFHLERRADEFWVTIRELPRTALDPGNSLPPEPPAPPVEIRLDMVTGSHHMQVFWLPTGLGNMQMGFPFTWLIDDQRWAPRNDTFIRNPHGIPPRETWNLVCIRCHTTAPQPRPNLEQETFDTRVAELGISCEACHGPAHDHVRLERDRRLQTPSPSDRQAASIIQPANLDSKLSSQICGFCHSMKWFDGSEPWEQNGFRFRPGDNLSSTTPVIRPTRLDAQPWLESVLEKNPALLQDFFWTDGMVRVSGREYNGLIESPCHERGHLSCVSCHSMHESEPDDQLARRMDGNHACLQCHTSHAQRIEEHTHHAAGSHGSLCYNCHMPHTTYGILKAIRSHQIDSPRIETTLKTGRPNACNLCHLDRSLAWAAERLNSWYGHPVPRLSTEEQEISAAVLWALRGDAGQRALLAWSMGWGPSLEASGRQWIPPFLATLLTDPYAAVRYMAHKSLKGHSEAYRSLPYDFAGEPQTHGQTQHEFIRLWQQTTTNGPSKALLLNAKGVLDQNRVNELLKTRNDRNIHLRE